VSGKANNSATAITISKSRELAGTRRHHVAPMLKTYTGSCHCGSTRFEVDLELDHVRVCDCSICRRRGALIHRVPEEALRVLTPLAGLAVYQWHTRTAKDYFCPKCGILPFRRPRMLTDEELKQGMERFCGWAINVRCLDGVDPESIAVRPIYGSELP
jgi:hypothetical protein